VWDTCISGHSLKSSGGVLNPNPSCSAVHQTRPLASRCGLLAVLKNDWIGNLGTRSTQEPRSECKASCRKTMVCENWKVACCYRHSDCKSTCGLITTALQKISLFRSGIIIRYPTNSTVVSHHIKVFHKIRMR